MAGPLSTQDLKLIETGLHNHGFAVIPAVVSKARLTEFNTKLIEAYDRSARFKGGGSISGHINCFPGEEARFAYEEIEASGIADLVRSHRPSVSNDVRTTLNFNLPGSVAQHYHMDGIYTEEFVICNVAVVDTDVLNGAIDVLPTTHLEFYPFWRYAVTRRYRLTTRVPMKQGDVLVRRSTLWHRGMPNLTSVPRPMLSFTFGEQSAPHSDPFTGSSGIRFYPNWYTNSGRLGVLRERVEVAMPMTRSLLRLAKSFTSRDGLRSH
jgi:hypothetical protein